MSVTELVLWNLLVTNRAARLWIISSLWMWSFLYGFHTVAQYSRMERTIVMYAIVFVSWLPILRLRLRKPSMLFEFFTILSIWGFQSSLFDKSTPRYLEVVSACNWCPFSLYDSFSGSLEVATLITLHLAGWNSIAQVDSHLSRAWRSSWRISLSALLLISLYTIQSSANRRTFNWMCSVRSFMKMRNSSWPRTVPWGTALTTGALYDVSPSMTTCCVRPDRNDSIHLWVLPWTP